MFWLVEFWPQIPLVNFFLHKFGKLANSLTELSSCWYINTKEATGGNNNYSPSVRPSLKRGRQTERESERKRPWKTPRIGRSTASTAYPVHTHGDGLSQSCCFCCWPIHSTQHRVSVHPNPAAQYLWSAFCWNSSSLTGSASDRGVVGVARVKVHQYISYCFIRPQVLEHTIPQTHKPPNPQASKPLIPQALKTLKHTTPQILKP